MTQPFRKAGLPALLVVDGLVLGFGGWLLSGLVDVPGAALAGLVALLGNLVAAVFALRGQAAAQGRRITLAAILAADAALSAALGFYIAQTDDAPGAALIGLVLLLANLAAATVVTRKRAPA